MDLSILAPEEARRILREAYALHGGILPAARGLGVSADTILDVVRRLGLREEFREKREKLRTRFSDPERK